MNLDSLLQPISDDAPCGRDCYAEPGLREIKPLNDYIVAHAGLKESERATRREYGDSEDDKSDKAMALREYEALKTRLDKQVAPRAQEVLGMAPSPAAAGAAIDARTEALLGGVGKDLAVVQRRCISAVATRGAAGLAECASWFVALVERFGDEAHPRPENGDQTLRANLAQEMVDSQDLAVVLRESTLLEAGMGRMIFRDAEVFDGVREKDPSGTGPAGVQDVLPIVSAIVVTEAGVKPSEVTAPQQIAIIDRALAPLTSAQESLRAVARQQGVSPDRMRVVALLARAARHLQALRERLDVAPAPPAAEPVSGEPQPRSASTPMRGMRTREDARHVILDVVKFLEATEPAHPASMFLQRAARLLEAKSFFEIVQDLLPGSAVEEVSRLTGLKPPAPPGSS